MTVIAALTLALGAGWCSGINLYATVFVLGALSKWTSFDLPGNLTVLENPSILAVAGILYTIEFFADKIPAVDTAWDAAHTFIRIPAGAVIAAMALGDVPIEFQVLAVLMGGTLAATAHTAKATTRLVAHSTGSSPVVSPAASVVEDGLVIAAMGLMAANPVLGALLIIAMIIAAVLFLYFFWKFAKLAWRRICAFATRKKTQSEIQSANA